MEARPMIQAVASSSAPPTDRQRVVYDMIRALTASRGLSPTIRELQAALGISSPNGVVCHLVALEKKGLIRRDPLLSRSIVVVGEPDPLPEMLACCRMALESPGGLGPALRARMERAVAMCDDESDTRER